MSFKRSENNARSFTLTLAAALGGALVSEMEPTSSGRVRNGEEKGEEAS